MPTPIKMPALSPTMEEGTLAKWHVKEGDTVRAGDIMAEIETDKATMEFEAVDEGTIAKIEVAEGTEGVKVGTVIALLAGEGEDAGAVSVAPPKEKKESVRPEPVEGPSLSSGAALPAKSGASTSSARTELGAKGTRVIASPLAKRIAGQKGIDLAGVTGSGPNGRIVKADVEATSRVPAKAGTSQNRRTACSTRLPPSRERT